MVQDSPEVVESDRFPLDKRDLDHWGQLAASTVKNLVDEKEWLDYLITYAALLKRLVAEVDPTNESYALLMQTEVPRNSNIRVAIKDLLSSVSVLSGAVFPGSMEDMISEYKLLSQDGRQSMSFVSKALNLRRRALYLEFLGAYCELETFEVQSFFFDQETSGLVDDPEPEAVIVWQRATCVPQNLLSWAVVRGASKTLGQASGFVYSELKISTIAGALDPVLANGAVDSEMEVADLMKIVVDEKQITTSVRRAFDSAFSSRDSPLACRKLRDLFFELYDSFYGHAAFPYQDGDSTVMVPREVLEFSTDCECLTTEACVGMLFTAAQSPKLTIIEHDVNPSIKQALSMSSGALNRLAELDKSGIAEALSEEEAAIHARFITDLLPYLSWRANAAKLLHTLKMKVMTQFSDDVLLFANKVLKGTPPTSHIVSDAVMIKPSAKKLVTDWKGKEAHTTNSVLLFRIMSSFSSLYEQLGLPGKAEEAFSDMHQQASTILQGASYVVRLVAHLNVIFNMTGEQQGVDANTLITKNAPGIPKTVWAELQEISKKAQKVPKKKKS